MVTISLCMIVKNEEDVLDRCLASVKDAVDEIIIVDTGSTDRTKEIAREYTPHVYDFEWVDDFSAARNFSFSKATMDYWMWLDADDILTKKDMKKLKQLKKTLDPRTDVVMLQYQVAFDDNGNPVFSYNRERIIRRTDKLPWQGFVHEAISPHGKVVHGDVCVQHRKLKPGDPDRNLRIFEKQIADGTPLCPRETYYYARELYYHRRYEDAITTFRSFLQEETAWVENRIEACQILSYCLYAVKRETEALDALFHSFLFDNPRSEICCDIGKYFYDRKKYNQSKFWYELALKNNKNPNASGFVSLDCYDFIPYLQLCLCHYYLGNVELANEYNEKAGALKPQNAAYLINKDFFQKITKS